MQLLLPLFKNEQMKTVFLIDDDPEDREIFESALKSLSTPTKYVEARDGQEGLELILRNDFGIPDYIFIDLNMPKIGGLELLTTVRKHPSYKAVQIFMYSTSSVDIEKEKCMEAGASGFITKHDSFGDLCSELKRVID